MPIQDLPTTRFANYNTTLGRFPGYHQEDDGFAAMRLQGYKSADEAAAQQAEIKAQQGLEGMRQQGDTQRAQIAANATTLAPRLQQGRFNQVFPWLRGQMGALQGSLGRVGGQSPPSPPISVGGVWDPGQVQQQVNAARAGNDQATQARQQAMQQQMAGRGFGANSPLAQALGVGMGNANMAANSDAERQIRWGAAQGNAQQLLSSQQARESQFATRQDEDIRRRQARLQQYGALIGALGGLV